MKKKSFLVAFALIAVLATGASSVSRYVDNVSMSCDGVQIDFTTGDGYWLEF